MPNNTRRNNNRKREAELFQNVLGVAGMSGYNNASRVGKHLSKRSAANNLTRMKRERNQRRVPNIQRRIENEYYHIQEEIQEIQDRYRGNNDRISVRNQNRLNRLRRRLPFLQERINALERETRRLVNRNGENQPENAPVAELPPNEFRARVNQLLRETRGEPEPAPDASPRALTLANALRLFGPNA
jgi:hypothetical protein